MDGKAIAGQPVRKDGVNSKNEIGGSKAGNYVSYPKGDVEEFDDLNPLALKNPPKAQRQKFGSSTWTRRAIGRAYESETDETGAYSIAPAFDGNFHKSGEFHLYEKDGHSKRHLGRFRSVDDARIRVEELKSGALPVSGSVEGDSA